MTPPTCDHLAAQQHWVIARRQLLALGWSKGDIRRGCDAKRLWPVHRGWYAVGRRDLTREGRWMAAVLACGEHAVLSHTTAGLIWQLLERGDGRPHVTTARHPRGPGGVTTHEALADVDHQRGIPVKTKI